MAEALVPTTMKTNMRDQLNLRKGLRPKQQKGCYGAPLQGHASYIYLEPTTLYLFTHFSALILSLGNNYYNPIVQMKKMKPQK